MLSQTHRVVESLLFSATEPLTKEQVKVCLQEEVNLDEIVEDLNDYYNKNCSPIWIQMVSEGFKLVTRSEYEPWIRRLYQNRSRMKLSASALETIAIVSYKQPVSRIDIEAIRGVGSDGTLRTLLERNLIEVKGRQNGPGRALLYGTTSYFLEYFGLNNISDLPRLKEIEEIFNEQEINNTSEADSS